MPDIQRVSENAAKYLELEIQKCLRNVLRQDRPKRYWKIGETRLFRRGIKDRLTILTSFRKGLQKIFVRQKICDRLFGKNEKNLSKTNKTRPKRGITAIKQKKS